MFVNRTLDLCPIRVKKPQTFDVFRSKISTGTVAVFLYLNPTQYNEYFLPLYY